MLRFGRLLFWRWIRCKECGLKQEVDRYKLREYGWQYCMACGEYLSDNRMHPMGGGTL